MKKLTRPQKILEAVTLLLFLAALILLLVKWDSIPDTVPKMFNGATGNKSDLILNFAWAFVVYLILSLISLLPANWNPPLNPQKSKETEEEKVQRHKMAGYIACFAKLFFVLFAAGTVLRVI